jgi:hypothetical protein
MRVWRLVVLIVAAVVWVPVHSDECIQPSSARLFASESGLHVFRVGQKRGQLPVGTLFAVGDDFRERRIWRTRLVNVPHRVLVPDDGRSAITIDNAGCGVGRAHSVVIYGAGGRVIGDYHRDDLLTADEIQQHVQQAMAGRGWIGMTRFAFASPSTFVVHLQWGRVIRINLLTGAMASSAATGRD